MSFFSRLKEVASPTIGLGCMNLSHGYGNPVPEAEAIRALEEAFEMGYRHFDTATLNGATAKERVVGKALASKRNEILLASKCGMAMDPALGKKVIDGRPETLRRQCEASLERLLPVTGPRAHFLHVFAHDAELFVDLSQRVVDGLSELLNDGHVAFGQLILAEQHVEQVIAEFQGVDGLFEGVDGLALSLLQLFDEFFFLHLFLGLFLGLGNAQGQQGEKDGHGKVFHLHTSFVKKYFEC